MQRALKLFIATSELLKSPLVTPLCHTCDTSLIVGEWHPLSLTLPRTMGTTTIEVQYNPAMVELGKAELISRPGRRLVTLKLLARGRELGYTLLTVYVSHRNSHSPVRSAVTYPELATA